MKHIADPLWQLDAEDEPYSPICEADPSAAVDYLENLENGKTARASSRRLYEDGAKNRKRNLEREEAEKKKTERPKQVLSSEATDKMLNRLYKTPDRSLRRKDSEESSLGIPRVDSVNKKLSYEQSEKLLTRLHTTALERQKDLSAKLHSAKEEREMKEVRMDFLQRPDDEITNTLTEFYLKGAKAISVKQSSLVSERIQVAPPSADTRTREQVYKQLYQMGDDKAPFVTEEQIRNNPTTGDQPFCTPCTKQIWKREAAIDASLMKAVPAQSEPPLRIPDEHFHEWSDAGATKLGLKTRRRLAATRKSLTPRGTPSAVRRELHSNLVLPDTADQIHSPRRIGGPKADWKPCHGKKDLDKWHRQSYSSLIVPHEE
eukprot:TRINITY_DN14408_c1_g1_i1.p1 TRINITY_DN14408_c1_g1~~TRINITY_DN14408_c1_g1_i1.p1  ORF type:complete len:374 (+),score=70.30 TRINITY_DN14408_c1_g1_i1:58-1179(+)